ncbi:uncharacterized protein [Dermacentor andersoni]|uniref:uncharacterized protein n=1 Tax=Dermacentor andersoni TaxID=34620 RepID=UPI003B3AD96D
MNEPPDRQKVIEKYLQGLHHHEDGYFHGYLMSDDELKLFERSLATVNESQCRLLHDPLRVQNLSKQCTVCVCQRNRQSLHIWNGILQKDSRVDLRQPCVQTKEGRLKADKAKQLQEALDAEQQTVARETRIYIKIANCGSHRNHGFEDMEAFSQNMDKNIAEGIEMLAREGITSVSDVKKCLHY